ncbi:PAS domain S-box protein [Sphingomonas sp. PAMC 26621]|uniref:PAS domain S-box protein n=1 Tax=Sphingomonas sp. PAMC 26621 TaxID=1112213 RepID=UPI0006858081|nr:PAS domain S-box protein [Sphingomonas sp. PAMC 26621]
MTIILTSEATRAQQERAQWWRVHTLDVLISTEQADTALNRAMRGERSYLATQRPQSLMLFEQSLSDFARLTRHVRELIRDNDAQLRRLRVLDRHVATFASIAQRVVDRVRVHDLRGAIMISPVGREREAVEAASVVLDQVKTVERRLLAQREVKNAQVLAQSARITRIVLGLIVLLLLLVAAAVTIMLRARAEVLRATDEVKASERLYRLMSENSNDMVVAIGLDGVRRYVSPACKSLLGYLPEELIGGIPVAAIHVEDRARVVETCQSLLTGIENPICSYRQQHRDGHYVWLEATYRLIRDDDGGPTEFVASVRDVSQRQAVEKRAAEAAALLEDNNRLFAMAASIAKLGHWRVDLTRNEVSWSSEVHRMHNLGLDYVPTLTSGIDCYHIDDRERVGAIIEEAIASGEPFDFAARIVLPDGTAREVAVQGQGEQGPNGDMLSIFGVIQDVSVQAAAQEAISNSERRYRLLADNATDVILRTDEAGIVTYISPSCVELSGYTADELLGRPCSEFIHPDDYGVVHAAHIAIITKTEPAVTVEYRLKQKEAGWRWLESHMKAWRLDHSGGAISAIRDIEQRKVLERDLVAARDAAEGAARAKSAFLANMSHEIRTPMNGVLGFTEIVLAGQLEAQQRRHVELIAESGRSMMRLLNDILDVSKIESGKMELAQEPVDLRHVIRRCVDLMEPVAQVKGVSLLTAFSADIPHSISGDALRLRQILLNLIGNALKFTDRGTVTIQCQINEDQLQLNVVDTGIGIAADRIEAIFEQFAQADERTAGRYGGTGLGLTISGNLARLMGGSITAKSVVGKGSTFSVVVPLRSTECRAPDVEASPPVAAAQRKHKPRVLVAEDHDINQALMMAMAERAGMDVTIAVDGLEAITMVEDAARADRPYDLVLMDMQMPKLDGLEATRRLRLAGHQPDTLPIVALTANAYEEDIRACLDAGMQAHLGKPIRINELTATLSRFIRKPRAEDTPASFITPKLRARYNARKAEVAFRLERLVTAFDPEAEVINDARDVLHKLSGTAAMFGEAALGKQARDLEELLLDWSAASAHLPVRAAVLQLIADLCPEDAPTLRSITLAP